MAKKFRNDDEIQSSNKRTKLGDGSNLLNELGAHVIVTESRSTSPNKRHYIIQQKRCDYIKPHANEHWIVNGPIQKCTSCSAKATGSGACRFERLRAFAAVPVGDELKNFKYDIRIHDTPETTSIIT